MQVHYNMSSVLLFRVSWVFGRCKDPLFHYSLFSYIGRFISSTAFLLKKAFKTWDYSLIGHRAVYHEQFTDFLFFIWLYVRIEKNKIIFQHGSGKISVFSAWVAYTFMSLTHRVLINPVLSLRWGLVGDFLIPPLILPFFVAVSIFFSAHCVPSCLSSSWVSSFWAEFWSVSTSEPVFHQELQYLSNVIVAGSVYCIEQFMLVFDCFVPLGTFLYVFCWKAFSSSALLAFVAWMLLWTT